MAKVLLVEDDNNLREIYEARLQAEGYDIATARDGEEALVVAKQEQPDLVISDVMMPKISGFEMLDIMRNTDGLRDIKVIMLTALGQSEDQDRADKLGADRYLVKSQVTLEDIVNASQDLLVEAGSVTAPAAAPAAAPATPAATPAIVPVTPAPEPVAVQPQPSSAPEPVAAPSQPVPEPTAPEPTPVAAPVVPEPAPTPSAPAPSTSDDSAQQTSSEESATVEHQIEDFVNTQSGQPEAQVDPTPETDVPAINANDTTPEQEQVLNDALQQLGGVPEAAPAPEQPAPTTETAPASAPVEDNEHHSKVIEPLHTEEGASATSEKSLEELLAAEEASEEGMSSKLPTAAPTNPVEQAPAAAPQQPASPPPPAAQPVMPPAQAAPKPANNAGDFDPNSIAL